jgi:hypothetical protein
MRWAGFLKTFLAVFSAFSGLLYAFVVAVNPYGNLPLNALGPHVIMDTNQRFQYPAIVRSGAYDSAVFGTSTSRLLNPADLERAFGGRFANLGLDSATAWEQVQLARLYLDHVKEPRTLLFGLDTVWCSATADAERITERGFPDWMFDRNPWNDWLYMLNAKALEIAGRKLAYRLGLAKERIPPNGFEVFTPPEDQYDLGKARAHIWADSVRGVMLGTPRDGSEAAPGPWAYPALVWLDELLRSVPSQTRVVLVFMPVHRAALYPPGTREEAQVDQCKGRVAAIAASRATLAIDFRIRSSITMDDSNYWDPLHYRLHIGRRIVREIKRAVEMGSGDTGGDWAFLSAPRRQE